MTPAAVAMPPTMNPAVDKVRIELYLSTEPLLVVAESQVPFGQLSLRSEFDMTMMPATAPATRPTAPTPIAMRPQIWRGGRLDGGTEVVDLAMAAFAADVEAEPTGGFSTGREDGGGAISC